MKVPLSTLHRPSAAKKLPEKRLSMKVDITNRGRPSAVSKLPEKRLVSPSTFRRPSAAGTMSVKRLNTMVPLSSHRRPSAASTLPEKQLDMRAHINSVCHNSPAKSPHKKRLIAEGPPGTHHRHSAATAPPVTGSAALGTRGWLVYLFSIIALLCVSGLLCVFGCIPYHQAPSQLNISEDSGVPDSFTTAEADFTNTEADLTTAEADITNAGADFTKEMIAISLGGAKTIVLDPSLDLVPPTCLSRNMQTSWAIPHLKRILFVARLIEKRIYKDQVSEKKRCPKEEPICPCAGSEKLEERDPTNLPHTTRQLCQVLDTYFVFDNCVDYRRVTKLEAVYKELVKIEKKKKQGVLANYFKLPFYEGDMKEDEPSIPEKKTNSPVWLGKQYRQMWKRSKQHLAELHDLLDLFIVKSVLDMMKKFNCKELLVEEKSLWAHLN